MPDTPTPTPAAFDPAKIPFVGGFFKWGKEKAETLVDTAQNLKAGLDYAEKNPEQVKLALEHPELMALRDKTIPMEKKIGLYVEYVILWLEDMFKGIMEKVKSAWNSDSQQTPEATSPDMVKKDTPKENKPSLPQHVIDQGKEVAANVSLVNGGSSFPPGAKQKSALGAPGPGQ